jgi:hypothetical protein
MLRECEVKNIISHDLPSLSVQLSYIKDENDVYGYVECLTGYTKSLINEDNLPEVEQCFNAAYDLLHQGNRLIQLAIENIFIYSVSHLLEVSLLVAPAARKLFLQKFSKQYSKQINSQYP